MWRAWVEVASSASGCVGGAARGRFGPGSLACPVLVVSAWAKRPGGVMCGESGKDRELRMLGNLCVALARLGVAGMQLRDAVPGVTVSLDRDGSAGVAAYVVIHHGARFSWWSVGHSHPISDVDGAAQAIVEFLHQKNGNGERARS
jgi:hypothetical protein